MIKIKIEKDPTLFNDVFTVTAIETETKNSVVIGSIVGPMKMSFKTDSEKFFDTFVNKIKSTINDINPE